MKIDLNKGALIEIGGELGKYNSLPVDVLVKIAQELQELIYALARHDLPSNEPIDINNFKIELVGFTKGSAIPKFAYSPRTEDKIGHHWQAHRNKVNEKFDKIVEVSNSGDYSKIIELYPEPFKRNHIVENLYSFVNSFGTAPVSFIEYDEVNEKITPIYKVNQFKPAVKKDLITEIKDVADNTSEIDEAVGRIQISKRDGKTKRKIIDTYSGKKFSLEYAPDVIVTEARKYHLKHPLRCLFEKEDNYYIIQSEMLGIIGTGLTEDDAEKSFSEEFDFIYNRLITLDDNTLTNHNRLIKSIIIQIIDRTEEK
jgi:hypothetical protein